MAKVIRRENESIDELLKRFKMQVSRDGIMSEIQKKEFYVSPSVKRKESKKAAIRKAKKNK